MLDNLCMGYWCARSFRALIALTLCYFNGKFEFDFTITYTLASFYSSIAFALPKKNMCMTCTLKLGRHAESVEVGTQPYRIRCYPINMSTASNISLRFLVKLFFLYQNAISLLLWKYQFKLLHKYNNGKLDFLNLKYFNGIILKSIACCS